MKSFLVGILIIVALLLAFNWIAVSDANSTAEAADNAAGKYQVTIDNFSFTPASLTVPVGTSVTWVNRDDVPHTIVNDNHKFRSRALDTDEKFSYNFTNPGTYEYYCSLHPKMTGKIVVE